LPACDPIHAQHSDLRFRACIHSRVEAEVLFESPGVPPNRCVPTGVAARGVVQASHTGQRRQFMPPGEITVTCIGCGSQTRLPFVALKRNSSYCSKCGKALPLADVRVAPNTEEARSPAPKRRPYRSSKRR